MTSDGGRRGLSHPGPNGIDRPVKMTTKIFFLRNYTEWRILFSLCVFHTIARPVWLFFFLFLPSFFSYFFGCGASRKKRETAHANSLKINCSFYSIYNIKSDVIQHIIPPCVTHRVAAVRCQLATLKTILLLFFFYLAITSYDSCMFVFPFFSCCLPQFLFDFLLRLQERDYMIHIWASLFLASQWVVFPLRNGIISTYRVQSSRKAINHCVNECAKHNVYSTRVCGKRENTHRQ